MNEFVVGLDGSDHSRMALRWAAAAAGAAGVPVLAVDGVIESDEMEGDPRHVLVTSAENFAAALTIVGRRGAGGLRSMRLGSTANHLVRHSPSNVAVVPTA